MAATGRHSPTAPKTDSCRSSSASSAPFSFRSEDSVDFRDYPPLSEYEEIPSLRSKSVPPPADERDGKTRYGPSVHASVYVAAGARSIFGMRRNNQVVSMEDAKAQDLHELDLFQTHVADRLRALTSDEPSGDDGEAEQDLKWQHRPLITLSFLQRLLDALLCIEEEFKALLPTILGRGTGVVPRAPLDRLVADLLDRFVRSLDVCNAVVQAIDSLHFCQKYAEIATSALCTPSAAAAAPPVSEDQFYRARKALSNLLAFLIPDQYPHSRATKDRPWLFSRGRGGDDPAAFRYGNRNLSLSVPHNWSAAKQVPPMWANFAPPRGADATAAAVAVYTMTAITVFATWTLVVAFPCQEQGGHGGASWAAAAGSRFPAPPWQVPWAAPMVALQERIAEEWRRGRRGSPAPGLLAELQSLVRCGRAVAELGGGGGPAFPLEGREREVVAGAGGELAAACRGMEEGLGPLRRRVREVFRRVVASRAEVLRCHGSLLPDTGKSAA